MLKSDKKKSDGYSKSTKAILNSRKLQEQVKGDL